MSNPVLSHVQPKRKYTKYICKQCHTILKSGKSPFDGDSNRCNDMCEYDKKCAEHNLSIHDYTCTCCHVVSNKRHLFIKFKEGKYMTLTSIMLQKAYDIGMSAHTMVNSFAEFVIDICQQTICPLKQ